MVKYVFQFQARNPAEEKSKAVVLSKEYKMIDCPVIQPKEVSMFFFIRLVLKIHPFIRNSFLKKQVQNFLQ